MFTRWSYLKTVGPDLISYLHESHQYSFAYGLCLFSTDPCEIVPESWMMIIMVVNFLTKAPKEGFMMHLKHGLISRFQNVWGHYIQIMQVPAFEGPWCLVERLSRS